MAKIAVELEKALARRVANGSAEDRLLGRILAQGEGWTVEDFICTSGPQDRPFEERHSRVSVAIVLAGTFQYRAANGRLGAGELMTPGSLLLGNAGQYFVCGHEHGLGDRCLSFQYAVDYFERIAADQGARRGERVFRMCRLPAVRALSPLTARAYAGLVGNFGQGDEFYWEELSIALAARAMRLANGVAGNVADTLPSAVARVTRAVRAIEQSSEAGLTIRRLAGEAGLSPYHFLRTFQQITGLTPHQYVLRVRLREAAMRLATERRKVLDILLDCGFGDVSSFNRAFRREYGVNPLQFRRRSAIRH